MTYVLGLKCKECGHRVPVSPVHVCEQCFGPYEVEYDYAKMHGPDRSLGLSVTPQALANGTALIQSNQQMHAGVFDLLVRSPHSDSGMGGYVLGGSVVLTPTPTGDTGRIATEYMTIGKLERSGPYVRVSLVARF